jgi:hypothetical protein
MFGDVNTETNQTPRTINLPDKSEGVENPPGPEQKPDVHVPPVEVPGRPQTPEHIPEKDQKKKMVS